jgi:hypothetical protein
VKRPNIEGSFCLLTVEGSGGHPRKLPRDDLRAARSKPVEATQPEPAHELHPHRETPTSGGVAVPLRGDSTARLFLT